jgi:Mrp family chromosome partitioning ATPase
MILSLKSRKKKQSSGDAFLAHYSLKSPYAEAYRTLRANLHFSMLDKELHVLLITSSLPDEGKSTSVANLGFTIAQSGTRVLLIDADMRKRGLSTLFNLKKAEGVSNLVGDVFGRPISSGAIADYGLKDLLTLLRLQKKTCRLTLKDDDNEADLLVVDGRLVDIYWKNRPIERKLANVLVNEKILTPEEARQALGYQEKSPRRLGAILLSLGLVKKAELAKAISLQMMEAFRVTGDMTGATFTAHNVVSDEIEPIVASTSDFDQAYHEYISTGNAPSRIDEAIDNMIIATDEKNLFVLPAGATPPNPAELLASTRTDFLLAQLRRRFDLLIIDSPPVIPVSDALLLAPQADSVVLVARAEKTNRKVAADSLRRLRTARANVIGCVLNCIDPEAHSYYHHYYSYGD